MTQTRLTLRGLSRWYSQLATSLEAGLSLERSIGSMSGAPAELRGKLQARLAAGDTIPEALERGGAWLPLVDRQLLAAAAHAGRLPEVLRRMAAMHEDAADAASRTFLAALYPILLLHVAILALPVTELVSGGGLAAYARKVALFLGPVWACGGLFFYAVRRRWRVASAVLDLLPWVGGYRRARALANLAMILEAQLVAGVRLDLAWLQAANASGDPRLHVPAISIAEGIQRGEPVGPKLGAAREFPLPFGEFYANGEQTGRLDESLAAIQREFRRRAAARLQTASMAYPGILFALVGAAIVYRILSFWLRYFGELGQFQ
jgi:type II secretory pathway component PulF